MFAFDWLVWLCLGLRAYGFWFGLFGFCLVVCLESWVVVVLWFGLSLCLVWLLSWLVILMVVCVVLVLFCFGLDGLGWVLGGLWWVCLCFVVLVYFGVVVVLGSIGG